MGAVGPDAQAERRRRFCARLLSAADRAGYDSLSSLARDVGVSKQAVNYWLTGRRSLPSSEVSLRISRALGVPVDWLLGADEAELLRGVLRVREIERAREERARAARRESGASTVVDSDSPGDGPR